MKKAERIQKYIEFLKSNGVFVFQYEHEMVECLEENFEMLVFRGTRECKQFVEETLDTNSAIIENDEQLKELCYKRGVQLADEEMLSLGELESGIKL